MVDIKAIRRKLIKYGEDENIDIKTTEVGKDLIVVVPQRQATSKVVVKVWGLTNNPDMLISPATIKDNNGAPVDVISIRGEPLEQTKGRKSLLKEKDLGDIEFI